MNKYQEALEYFMCAVLPENLTYEEVEKIDGKETAKHYISLKELIDKTTICGLSLDEAIPIIQMYKQLKYTTMQIEPIEDLMMGTKGAYYYDGKHSISQLEKALDKACYELCTYCDGCEDRRLIYTDEQLKQFEKEAKEYLFKESEKQ